MATPTNLAKSLSRVFLAAERNTRAFNRSQQSRLHHCLRTVAAGQLLHFDDASNCAAIPFAAQGNKVPTWNTSDCTRKQQQATATIFQSRRFLVTSAQRLGQDTKGEDDGGKKEEQKTVLLSRPQRHIASVELNNARTKNAFCLETADELVRLFGELERDSSIRCVLLSGKGPNLTSGVDIKSFMSVYSDLQSTEDVAHRAHLLKRVIERFQAPFKRMHAFGKPIVCVQHGLSLGLGMEMAACSDVRYCSRDTKMAIREVLIGIAADVGSLQLMPRLAANQSLLAELIYTGRYITIEEAHRELKFVSRVFDTKEAAMEGALELASTIVRRSPVAVQGSKRNLRFSREHSFETGLDYNAVWNAAMMQGGDLVTAIGAVMSKQVDEAEYEDL